MPVIEVKGDVLTVEGRLLAAPEAIYAAECIARAARRCNPGQRVRLARWHAGTSELSPAEAFMFAGELFQLACVMLAQELGAASTPSTSEGGV